MSERPHFDCPRCGRRSFLPSDIAAGYCGACHWWTGDSLLGSPEVIAQAELDGPLHPEMLAGRRLASAGLSLRESIDAVSRVMAQLGESFERVGNSFVRWRSTMREEQGMVRISRKRLRGGLVRVRVRRIPQAQPEPWKARR